MVPAVEFAVGCVQGDVRPGGDGVEADAERAIGGLDVDRSVAIAALGEGMADQVEKEPEGVVFERAELREASTPAFGQTSAGACQLVGLVMGESLEMGLFRGAIDDRRRRATADGRPHCRAPRRTSGRAWRNPWRDRHGWHGVR